VEGHCRGLWQSSVGEAAAAAVAGAVGVVEVKAGMAVVVGAGRPKTVDDVRRVELDAVAAVAAAGIATETVVVASRVVLEAAAAGVETTNAAAVARVLLDNLRPRAGTGYTGHEQSATDRVAQLVAGLIGELGFVAVLGADVDLHLGNTLPETDIPDSGLDMKSCESDHQCTVEY